VVRKLLDNLRGNEFHFYTKGKTMTATTEIRNVPNSFICRWIGRAAAIVLFVSWLGAFAAEIPRSGLPSSDTYLQAITLSVAFLGYLVGWWNELVGGIVTIGGTIAWVVVCVLVTNVVLQPEMLWFAAPGMCYLAAYYLTRAERIGATHES
jgi:hypothetical protein